MPTEERRTEFHEAVARHHLSTGASRSDRPLAVIGAVLMLGGVVGALVQYNVSLSQDDARDIASTQILAIALLSLAVVGAALFVTASIARVLRLWLLRQLLESQVRADQLVALVSAQQERL